MLLLPTVSSSVASIADTDAVVTGTLFIIPAVAVMVTYFVCAVPAPVAQLADTSALNTNHVTRTTGLTGVGEERRIKTPEYISGRQAHVSFKQDCNYATHSVEGHRLFETYATVRSQ